MQNKALACFVQEELCSGFFVFVGSRLFEKASVGHREGSGIQHNNLDLVQLTVLPLSLLCESSLS